MGYLGVGLSSTGLVMKFATSSSATANKGSWWAMMVMWSALATIAFLGAGGRQSLLGRDRERHEVTRTTIELCISYAEKPQIRDSMNRFGDLERGYRKVRIDSTGAGFIMACGGKFGHHDLAAHVGRWVYVVPHDYSTWCDSAHAIVGLDRQRADPAHFYPGLICNAIK